MSTQKDFGKRIREFRKRKNLTQKEIAMKIGVSEQALSKWENETAEKVIETITINGAVFEVVEKPAAILAGKIIFAKDLSKEQCEIWELFAYIRDYFMPAHNFKMAENGAQELEVFDTFEHKSGYAYMPVMSR